VAKEAPKRGLLGLSGRVIDDKYRVDSLVGEGGFGVVYRGEQLRLEVPIAIKCLKIPWQFSHEAKEAFVVAFHKEAKILARLGEHPHIVRVFDFGSAELVPGQDVSYLVLEWLEGCDLQARLGAADKTRPTYTEEEAIDLLRPAIDAVAFAHDEGVVHRDLKPANLFLAEGKLGSSLKVLDFGIAKAMEQGETALVAATGTASGMSAFSLPYGAPEQFHSKKYGATGTWTDVHAFGLLLTELVAGRRVLEGETFAELMLDCLTPERPTPRRLGATVSDAFEAACARALAIDTKERFVDARALAAALEEIAPASADRSSRNDAVTIAVESPAETLVVTPESSTLAGIGRAKPAVARTDQQAPTPIPRTQVMNTPPGVSSNIEPAAKPIIAPLPEPVVDEDSLADEVQASFDKLIARSSSRGRTFAIGAAAVAGIIVAFGLVAADGDDEDDAPYVPMAVDTASPAGRVKAEGVVGDRAKAKKAAPEADRAKPARSSAITRKDGARMVLVPSGTFTMGDDKGSDRDERPQSTISLDSFYIDRTEVTVSHYSACVRKGLCSAAGKGKHCNGRRKHRLGHPINCVSHSQAKTFCRSVGVRLPTEAEWEKASRGQYGRSYPWGDAVADCSFAVMKDGRGNGCGSGTTQAVMTRPGGKSTYGAYDMAGNVYEWTADWYDKTYYSRSKNKNPPGPFSGKLRVIRGGSFDEAKVANLRGANRGAAPPSKRVNYIGFRCAKSGG